MLNKEYTFFKKNLSELLKKYQGKYLIIKDEKVASVFPTYDEALTFGLSKFKLGEFLIQECVESKESTAQFFNSYFFMR